jgi:Uma2 family endonuclease
MTLLDPPIAHFTADEFDHMVDNGAFGRRRVCLIDGVITDMAAQGEPHWVACELASQRLHKAFGDGWVIRKSAPLRITDSNQPEPDLLVYAGQIRDTLASGRPTTGAFVVEVSDTTLPYDRRTMARLYALASIPEYWIINLPDRQLEVHRDPDPTNGLYHARFIVKPGQTLLTLAIPTTSSAHPIDPADLLP